MHTDDLDPPPASMLLDRRGYIDDRTNATTAEGVTSGGKRMTHQGDLLDGPPAALLLLHGLQP
jgi:hypothetical protein